MITRLAALVDRWTPPRFAAAASPSVRDAVARLRLAVATTATGPVPTGPSTGGSGDAAGEAPGDAVVETLGHAVHAVVQSLADLNADLAGRSRRPVPRLPHDTALADQLTVVGHDVLTESGNPDGWLWLGPVVDALDDLRASL